MKVKAKALGFYGNQRRRPGDEFDYQGDKAPSWVEVLEDVVEVVKKVRGKAAQKPEVKAEAGDAEEDSADPGEAEK